MSQTTNLGLFKHDNPAINTNAFDVKSALNDNWDKIDEGIFDINNYVDQEISSLQSQINGLASGSPLPASSISEMTDTTKIYVNTTDGKWYYYNGSQWVAGGTYQSSGIGVNSINPEQLNNNKFDSVFKFYKNNLKPISNNWQSGAWNGSTILSNVNAISCFGVSLKTGNVISIVGDFEFAIYKGSTRLRYYSTDDYTISTNGDDYAFIIVKNPREDITQYVNSAKNIVGLSNYKIEFTEINYDDLSEKLKENIDATQGTLNLNNNSNWKPGYYNTEQEYIFASGYSTIAPLQVEIDNKLNANLNGANTVYTIFKCDENGNLLQGLKTGTGNDPIDFSYNIDFNGYIGVTYRNVGIPNVYVKIIKNPKNLQNQIDDIKKNTLSDSLLNCNYVSEGDSITNRNGKPSSAWQATEGYTPYETSIIKGYQDYVVEKLNCTLANYGAEGYTIVNMLNDILNRDYSNVDLVTIAFGVNDARTGVVLGDLGGYSDTTFNTSTFTGAYRTAINHMLEDNPNIKIILMTPIQRDLINNFGTDTPNINGNTLVDFRDRIIEIAKIYSLPVCDCFAESEINNYNIKELTIDGVHPNNAGYKCMGKLLCSIINKL